MPTARIPSLPSRWKRWARPVALGAGGLALATMLGGVILFWTVLRGAALPDVSRLESYHPKLVTRIYSADNVLLGELAQERRTVIPMEKIPKILQQAVIDAEDAQFYQHRGVSYLGMLRALYRNLRHGRFVQGGSTITQQVVKTFLLTPERTIKRKIQEVYLAYRLENNFTKDQILWLYLNQINFGHGRYGCQEASRFYFAKDAIDLNAGEAALLAGLPQSPARLEPVRHSEAAKRRQVYVLGQMQRHGHLSAEESDRWAKEPFRIVGQAGEKAGIAPEAIDMVRQMLSEQFGEENLATMGVEVRTTIDSRLQQLARQSVEHGLETLDEREQYRGPTRRLRGKALTKFLAGLHKQMENVVPKTSTIYEAVVEKLDDPAQTVELDLGGPKGLLPLGNDTRYNPEKRPPSQRFRPGDVVRVRPTGEKRADAYVMMAEFGPQSAMVVIEPSTRHIKALVGGYRFVPGSFNRALRARRQAGSAFKPFLYATAFDSRKYTPASVVNDAPEVYDLWKPQNDEREQFRGPIRLRTALAHSVNTVAIRLMADLGPGAVVETAHKLGIRSELAPDLSLALGTSSVTVLEMANAYTTFPAQGKYSDPILVVSVDGKPVPAPPETQAMKPDVAFVTTEVLSAVIEEGTARSASGRMHRPAAGKTGTTNAHRDAWFIGFTPELLAAVWVGFDDVRPLGAGEQGSRAALPVWISFMTEALKNRPPAPFTQPPGVVVERIDPKTGLLAPSGAQNATDEYFLEGTQPTQVAAQGDGSAEDFLLDQAGGTEP